MDKQIKKIVRKICGGDATCEKYVEGAVENLRPKIRIAYKCTCKRTK